MADFKVGDRVRRVTQVAADALLDPPVGAEGVVVLFDGHDSVCVGWVGFTDGHDGGTAINRNDCYWVFSEELELIA